MSWWSQIPRAGMSEKLETLMKLEAPKIVYVSCNPETQARMYSWWAKSTRWLKMQPVDMFPHTNHIENGFTRFKIINHIVIKPLYAIKTNWFVGIYCHHLSFGGLVLSRSLYSVGLLLMALYCFLNAQSTGLWCRPWFWSMLAIPAIVLWADGFAGYRTRRCFFFIKLSLPLFPLFFFAWRPGYQQIKILIFGYWPFWGLPHCIQYIHISKRRSRP